MTLIYLKLAAKCHNMASIIIANLIKPIGAIVKKYDIKIERNSQLSDFNTSGVITFPASASIGFSGYSGTFPYEIGKSGGAKNS